MFSEYKVIQKVLSCFVSLPMLFLTQKGEEWNSWDFFSNKVFSKEKKIQKIETTEERLLSLPILIKIELLYFRFYANSGSDPVVQVIAAKWYIELVFPDSSDDAPRSNVSFHYSVAVDDKVRCAASLSHTFVQSRFEDVVGWCLDDGTIGIQQTQKVSL